MVRVGRALEHLPGMAAAFAAGAVTAEQVAMVAPITRGEHLAAAAQQEVDLGEVDAAPTSIATAQPHPVLRQAVHRYVAMLDPNGPEPDASSWTRCVERQPDGRWRTWRPDGTEILTGPPLLNPAA